MSSSDLLEQIRSGGEIPRHVAIIMDGNGRWAKQRNRPRTFGHRAGMRAVREVVEAASDAGVEVLTLYAFSQENWGRPPAEVSALMALLELYVRREREDLRSKGVQVKMIGEAGQLSPRTRRAMESLVEHTASGTRLRLNLAISYGSRTEIVHAARVLAERVLDGTLVPGEIDEALFAQQLYTADVPDPDLLIRTSGELRISNFMLWQLAYTELHVTPVLWPEFNRAELFGAIREFQRRERRFGRVLAR
ncbi:MAG TPA: isoprenyl transferase [Longimicrobium sp.]|jgi:undecaprenyl diphosphate synthase